MIESEYWPPVMPVLLISLLGENSHPCELAGNFLRVWPRMGHSDTEHGIVFPSFANAAHATMHTEDSTLAGVTRMCSLVN